MSGRLLTALATMLFLTACAGLVTQAGRPQPSPPFDFSGRVLVSADGRAFSSGIRWRHDAEQDELWLLSPLGQALAHIEARPGNATFTSIDRQPYFASSVESLTRHALGWELPLSQLQYWIQGRWVTPESAQTAKRDRQGRLVFLDEAGWRVHIDYPPEADRNGRPRRLELSRGGQKIRLVIDAWRVSEVSP